MKIGIIGGSGVYSPDMMANVKEVRVETPYGMVRPMVGEAEGHEVVFLPRHGAEHSVPPHRINYQANIWGMRTLGVEAIIATAAVGSLNPEMRLGVVLLTSLLIFTKTAGKPFLKAARTACSIWILPNRIVLPSGKHWRPPPGNSARARARNLPCTSGEFISARKGPGLKHPRKLRLTPFWARTWWE